MTYRYPARDLDKPRRLLDLLGSFWAATYESARFVERYAFGRARLEQQSEQNLNEALAAVSRLQVPVYHTDQWYQLVFRESAVNSYEATALRYGSEAVYGPQIDGDGRTYAYGDRVASAIYRVAAPAGFRGGAAIANRLSEPSVYWQPGLDWTYDNGYISLRTNPFQHEDIPIRDVYEGDQVVDREVSLWVFNAQIDLQHIWTHFGHVISLDLPSSLQYRDLVNSLWDGLVEGGHRLAATQALAAITDVPIVRQDLETVVEIARDARSLLVITDKEVYRFRPEATAIVAVGDQVRLGQQLVDAVQFFELNRGQVPADLAALTLGRNFLTPGFFDGLTFCNREVPLVVDTSDVFTKVSFELGGWPGDVDKFWDDMHTRGVAAGQTLAHLLDTRTNKVGEPGVLNLPATINPLRFLIENIFRYHLFVVQMRPTLFGPQALPLAAAQQLRRIVPPHTGYILRFQLVCADAISMDGPGDADTPGYAETAVPYVAGEPISENLNPAAMISEMSVLRYVDGVCL